MTGTQVPSWHMGPMFAWDLETTGANPDTARIVTATAVWIHGAVVTKRTWLVDTGVEIPAEATAIHGVTTERARAEGVDPALAAAQLWSEIEGAWSEGRPVIGYNLSYDFTVLDRELRRHCATHIDDLALGPIIDGYVVDKELDRYRRGSRKLIDVCEHYGVRLEAAHDATEDALAAARLAWRMAQVYAAHLGDLSKVNGLQAAWRARWARDFEEYLRKQGKDEDVDGQWPVRAWVPTPDCIGDAA